MNFFQHRYFRTTKNLMTVIGQWPDQSISVRRRFLVVVTFLAITQMLPMMMGAVKYINDRNIFIDSVLTLFYGVWCTIKLLTLIWNSEKMLIMLNRIRADWLTWSGDREIKILHKYAEQARKFIIVYAVMMYSIGFVYLTQPILPKIIDVTMGNGSKPGNFPIPVYYYFFDQQKYYFYIIVYTYLCLSMTLTITISYDIALIFYVQHSCAIFTAVGQKLERIGKNDKASETEEIIYHTEEMKKNYEDIIIICIERHNDAIEYAKLVESTYTWSFFATVILRVAMISVSGLQLLTRTNDPQETAKIISFAGGLLAYVYMESYIAQIFMDHSISIRNYIQNGHWYILSLKAQKLLQFMTMRCNVPCQLTAGKMLNMSVESFAVFLKTSISYLTLLRSM